MKADAFTGDARPPAAERRPQIFTEHGRTRTDEYGWLRADNWQEVMRDPSVLADDIRAHLEAENAYQEALMADTTGLQQTLFAEMKGRIKEDDSSVPMKDGPWSYGISYVAGGEQPRLIRLDEGGAEHLLIDGDEEAEGRDYFRFGGTRHSPDHGLIAWAFDDKGSEYYTVAFRDPVTGEDLGDRITDTGGGGTWSADSANFFYTRLDDNHRPSKLFRHAMGSSAQADELVYEETDPGFFMGAGKTQSGEFIVIDIHDHRTSESWLIPAEEPTAEPRLVAARETGVEYSIDEAGGVLYILTNRDGAKDFKIVTAPADAPGPENWTDLVPHKPGRLIIAHAVYARHLVRLEREDGLPRIVIRRLGDGDEHAIEFDEAAYSLGFDGALEFDTDVIRFTYSSMTTPTQTYDYDMATRERTLRKTQEVPSGHDPADYATTRIFAAAKDGEQVPISLVHRKDTPLDGSAPCLLYGYGSYGIAIPASFNTNCLSLVDRGFVYAIAHVRGGKDKGFSWYEAGKLEHKKNTFTDFLACAQCLADEGYTSHGRIVAHGGSAGGMLMGVVANLEPAAFAGIIAEVPFVDVLATMLDDTLPLTPPEWPEWGNPIESAADHANIASYSPYDQVCAQAYPPILAVAGLTDPRVTYWEPAKWVARLRAMKTGDAPVLLKTNMGAGHAGAAGRFERLTEVALSYAFAVKTAGLALR